MKKISIILSVLLLAVLALCFVSCAHTHEFGEWETLTAPTCTADGEQKRVCKCGYEELEVISATGHTAGNTATCTEDQTCTTCGEILAAATGHTAGDEATCTTPQTCTACNEVLAEALGHTEGEWIVDVEPTCTLEGSKHQICSVCEDTINTDVIAALGHTEYAIDAVSPGCTKDGLTEGRYCGVCNEITLAQKTVAALGHEWVIDRHVEPTCSQYGWTEGEHCSRCNEVKTAQERIEKLDHTPTTDEAKAPTCTESGLTEGSHCEVCLETIVKQKTVAATGHDFDMTVNACTVCGDKEYEIEITNSTEYEQYRKEKEVVFYFDKYVTPDVADTEFCYYISKDTEYIRFVGSVDRGFKFCIEVEKRTEPLKIDFVNTSLYSQNSIVKATSEVDIEIGLYGDKCILFVDKAADGEDSSLFSPWPKDGANGADAIHVAGKLTVTIAAQYCGIVGGDGGNGGDAADSWGQDANDGGDGGNGGYALYATEIYVSIAKNVNREMVFIDAGWGGSGGKGGHAYGLFGGDSWLYDDGEYGDSGTTPNDTNVEIIYK